MYKFDKVYNSIFKRYDLFESVIDIPRNSLNPAVFNFPDEGLPILRPAIKVQILNDLEVLNNIVQVNNAYIIGSILTKQWNQDSDIDVNVEVDEMEPLVKEAVFNYIRKTNGKMAQGTTHPINYYIVEGEEYDIDKTQAAYDVASERWIKEPEDVDIMVVSYLDRFKNAIEHIDLTIANLRRNIIDYDELRNLDRDQIKQLGSLLKNKLEEIEADIEFLIKSKRDIVDARKVAFTKDMTPEEINKYGKKWKLPENIIYKLLEKYYYIDFIRNIKNLYGDDEELEPHKIKDIKRLGREQWN